jgi:serine/threonine protein kinase
LHTRNPAIVHGDIKASNVLISTGGRAVLCDFGLSEIESICGAPKVGGSGTPSLRWCAPEVLLGKAQSPSSDIWSFGCLILEVRIALISITIFAHTHINTRFRPRNYLIQTWKLMMKFTRRWPKKAVCPHREALPTSIGLVLLAPVGAVTNMPAPLRHFLFNKLARYLILSTFSQFGSIYHTISHQLLDPHSDPVSRSKPLTSWFTTLVSRLVFGAVCECHHLSQKIFFIYLGILANPTRS